MMMKNFKKDSNIPPPIWQKFSGWINKLLSRLKTEIITSCAYQRLLHPWDVIQGYYCHAEFFVFTHLQAPKALRDSVFLDLGTRMRWVVSVTPRPLSTPRKDPVPIVQEAGWAPRPVWTGAENLTPTRIRSLDCPAGSQSLHQLSYPAHTVTLRPD
jgi:hypothetical protein